MTSAEYKKFYNQAKNRLTIVENKIQKQLLQVYIDAGALVEKKIRQATEKQLEDYVINGLKSIDNQIKASADIISQAVEDALPIAVTDSYSAYGKIETNYMFDVAKPISGFDVTKSGLVNVTVAVNDNLVKQVFNIQFDDKLTYSDRIWGEFKKSGLPAGVNGDFQYRIKNVINAGTVQGRDPIKIAQDLNVYLKDGKIRMVKRYGKLVRGTRQFINRISKKVDWRAVRLVRSVQNNAMQLGSIQSAQINPGHSGLYNWKKTPGNPIDPDGSRNASGMRCIDLEDGNPYTAETIPGYQHPSDSCRINPILRDRRQFEKDIKDFVDNGTDNYIATWFEDVYEVAQ